MELKYSKHDIQSLRKMIWQHPQNQENVIFEVDWNVNLQIEILFSKNKPKKTQFCWELFQIHQLTKCNPMDESNDTNIEIEKKRS